MLSKRFLSYNLVNHKASILIVSLWSICLLSAFAVIINYTVRQKISFVFRLEERRKVSLLADAGAKKAIMQVEKEGDKAYNCLKDAWSNNPEEFKDSVLGDGKMNIGYETPAVSFRHIIQPASYRSGLIDEERKINVNKEGLGVLKRLFQLVLGLEDLESQELAASVIDWRDADSALTIPLGSAEDSYYRGLPLPYEAKDADFEVIEELLLVKGINADMLGKLRDYITCFGEGKININTASWQVLSALGLNDVQVEQVLTFRAGGDGLEGTEDDGVFTSVSEIVPKLTAAFKLSAAQATQLEGIAERSFSVSSSNFTVRNKSQLINSKFATETYCVFDSEGKILHWQEQ